MLWSDTHSVEAEALWLDTHSVEAEALRRALGRGEGPQASPASFVDRLQLERRRLSLCCHPALRRWSA